MRVRCFICEQVDTIEDESPQAKKLRNRPIHTYLCQSCHTRISEKTEARKQTGHFKMFETKKEDEDWI